MPLASRIIPVVLMDGGQAVKGEAFGWKRPIGQVRMTVRVHQTRGVDELVLLDISGSVPDFARVRDLAGDCFFPLTVGGGVRSLDHVVGLISNGADKVAINTAAVETPDLITAAATKIGAQSVVVSMDIRHGSVWVDHGRRDTGILAVDHARDVERLGAGEVLLTSIDRDGTLTGYDLDLIARVSGSVSIPVVACGGAGSYKHLQEGLNAGAHAVAAGALWSFTDATPSGAADYLFTQGFSVRRQRMIVPRTGDSAQQQQQHVGDTYYGNR